MMTLPFQYTAPRLTTSQHATPCEAAAGCGLNTHFSGAPGLREIEREEIVRIRRDDIKRVVDDDRRRFLPARDAGRERERDLQILRRALVDLVELGKARRRRNSSPASPTGRRPAARRSPAVRGATWHRPQRLRTITRARAPPRRCPAEGTSDRAFSWWSPFSLEVVSFRQPAQCGDKDSITIENAIAPRKRMLDRMPTRASARLRAACPGCSIEPAVATLLHRYGQARNREQHADERDDREWHAARVVEFPTIATPPEKHDEAASA